MMNSLLYSYSRFDLNLQRYGAACHEQTFEPPIKDQLQEMLRPTCMAKV